jgi:anti-sigma B factor antagonist
VLRHGHRENASEATASGSVVVKFALSEPRREDEVTVIGIEGELDLASAPRLKEPLESALAESGRGVVLDMSGVTFMDSTAFRVLSEARRRHEHVPLAICCHNENVLRIFKIAGFERSFTIHRTLEEAISQVQAEAISRT